MKLLFIGDIVGKSGRTTASLMLGKLKKKHQFDLVIANGENMSHGKGVSKKTLEEMQNAGVDFFTAGNHIWADKSIIPLLDEGSLPIIRPANYPSRIPGRGYEIITTKNGERVLVINLLGQIFIKDNLNCPFETADKILEEFEKDNFSAIFVDFHAEASSEKCALANYLDGRVTAVIGTHTHIATSDARILPGGTAFQSDAGFCGSLDSIIGANKQPVIEHFLSKMPLKIEPAEGAPFVFGGVMIDSDDKTGKAISIEQIYEVID